MEFVHVEKEKLGFYWYETPLVKRIFELHTCAFSNRSVREREREGMSVCVCACVRVCVWERERKGEWETNDRKREREEVLLGPNVFLSANDLTFICAATLPVVSGCGMKVKLFVFNWIWKLFKMSRFLFFLE